MTSVAPQDRNTIQRTNKSKSSSLVDPDILVALKLKSLKKLDDISTFRGDTDTPTLTWTSGYFCPGFQARELHKYIWYSNVICMNT